MYTLTLDYWIEVENDDHSPMDGIPVRLTSKEENKDRTKDPKEINHQEQEGR